MNPHTSVHSPGIPSGFCKGVGPRGMGTQAFWKLLQHGTQMGFQRRVHLAMAANPAECALHAEVRNVLTTTVRARLMCAMRRIVSSQSAQNYGPKRECRNGLLHAF